MKNQTNQKGVAFYALVLILLHAAGSFAVCAAISVTHEGILPPLWCLVATVWISIGLGIVNLFVPKLNLAKSLATLGVGTLVFALCQLIAISRSWPSLIGFLMAASFTTTASMVAWRYFDGLQAYLVWKWNTLRLLDQRIQEFGNAKPAIDRIEYGDGEFIPGYVHPCCSADEEGED